MNGKHMAGFSAQLRWPLSFLQENKVLPCCLGPLSCLCITNTTVVPRPFQGRLGGHAPVLRSDLGGEVAATEDVIQSDSQQPSWRSVGYTLSSLRLYLVFQTSAGDFTRVILLSQGQLGNIFLISDLCSRRSVTEKCFRCSQVGVC